MNRKMQNSDGQTEGANENYYILPDGRLVFTSAFLLKRGFCCGNGCMNCPFDYLNVIEPQRSQLLQERNKKRNEN